MMNIVEGKINKGFSIQTVMRTIPNWVKPSIKAYKL